MQFEEKTSTKALTNPDKLLEEMLVGNNKQIDHHSVGVNDWNLNNKRKTLQLEMTAGCLRRLNLLLKSIDQDADVAVIATQLSRADILDYRDKYSLQTINQLTQAINAIELKLSAKGLLQNEVIETALHKLKKNLEENQLKVLYVFDPLELRADIFEEFRENMITPLRRMKALKKDNADPNEIQALKAEMQELRNQTREKLILSVELITRLQSGFTAAYQDMFPKLAAEIEELREETGELYPELNELAFADALEIGLVENGIFLNINQNNIREHLNLLAKNHNDISRFLVSFDQALTGEQLYKSFTKMYLGKEVAPRGKIRLILEPPYHEIGIECLNKADYLIMYSKNLDSTPNNSAAFYQELNFFDGLENKVCIPTTVSLGKMREAFRKHEQAHALQYQMLPGADPDSAEIETIAANREKWIVVCGVTQDEIESKDILQLSERKKSQIYLAEIVNAAITRAREEIQAYTRQGDSPSEILDHLQNVDPGALYNFVNTTELRDYFKTTYRFGGNNELPAEVIADIEEAHNTYQVFLADAVNVVSDYLRLLGDDPDARETASIMIRFTTFDELKYLVNLLKERKTDIWIKDNVDLIYDGLEKIDPKLSATFDYALTQWHNLIELTQKSLRADFTNSVFYLFLHDATKYSNFGKLKKVGDKNRESIQASVDLRLQSPAQLVSLCEFLGVATPYQEESQLIYRIPTNIYGLTVTARLDSDHSGRSDISLNFDLETFQLMLNRIGPLEN